MDYEKILQEIMDQESELGSKVAILLGQARTDILTELASHPAEWRSAFLGSILYKVEQRLVELRNSLIQYSGGITTTGQNLGWRLGTLFTPSLQAAPVGVFSGVGIDTNLLKVLADYRADLLTSVTNSCKDKITEIIRRGVLSGKPLQQVEAEIGSALPNSGIFKSINARTQTIVRTEYNRVLQHAAQKGMEESAQYVPGLRKRWVCRFRNSRDPHILAHGQTVLVNEDFIVGGEKLMYPHDAKGSASNTINCYCISVPVVPEEDTE